MLVTLIEAKFEHFSAGVKFRNHIGLKNIMFWVALHCEVCTISLFTRDGRNREMVVYFKIKES